MSKRIQQRRTRGWRKPEGAVSVARPHLYGNPFKIGDLTPAANWPRGDPRFDTEANHRVSDAAEAVELFREQVRRGEFLIRAGGRPDGQLLRAGGPSLLHVQADLRGRDLMCFCPLDQPCHADILLELANA